MLAGGRGVVLGVFCPPDSARGRFKVPVLSWLLTIGVLDPLEGRAPSCANGLSEAAVEALEIFIFGFGVAACSFFSIGLGVEVETGGVVAALLSVLGVDGPASFSSRRLRI